MALTTQELADLAECGGPHRTILAGAIGELFLANPAAEIVAGKSSDIAAQFPDILVSRDEWVPTGVRGAVIFVVDREMDTFLFQIFDLDGLVLRFQFEAYENLEYQKLEPHFHAFELDDCTSKDDDLMFAQYAKSEAKAETMVFQVSPLAQGKPTPRPLVDAENAGPKDIGAATNVVRTGHVGVNADGSLDLSEIPAEWKHLFRQAGLRKSDLSDPHVKDRIRDAMASAGIKTRSRTITRTYSRNLHEDELCDAPRRPSISRKTITKAKAQQSSPESAADEHEQQRREAKKSQRSSTKEPGNTKEPKPMAGFLGAISQGDFKLRKVSVNEKDEAEKKKKEREDRRPAFLREIETGVVSLRRLSEVEALPELDDKSSGVQDSLLSILKTCVLERRDHVRQDEADATSVNGDEWSDDGWD
ncbi:Neural Wiskott-Aldrich syndrome protein [Hondaea fermentalgiana]|uniref:Neural Wiskott-Aldrich syndrome protein n=1 Tax=Hondaea fermentalgiana TaxID=2315210 RepID=A0A2R5GA59_9STRA|nr:Neural Wiskott-Aldrich syndrome protein [Hondaea fermentalgiana]|eukprot:GBG24574.1 Neural Wiskott-Aldrich syndrome protein [Hondaea fermentalgiana]